ncbi:MAG TPA: c-type cytochrome [Verrucomicrobiae bacterium]|nr:c-type cytochrome [Verrucomicrobiae bacterium]
MLHAIFAVVLVADVNAGAKLVAQNGCQACHGTTFRGTAQFPALYGVEHRLTRAQIVTALTNPKAPMPNYGFSVAQAGDIADYLSGLDGGAAADQPVITIAPAHPVDYADVTVRFPGSPPQKVTAVATMAMGNMPMKSPQVVFKPTSDPHVYTGRIAFSMSGAWTIHIVYDGKTIDRPIVIGR